MLRSKGCHQPGRQGLRVKRQGSCVKARAGKGKGGRPWGYPMAASMNVRSHDLSPIFVQETLCTMAKPEGG